MTPEEFIAAFPAFADEPEDAIERHIALGVLMLDVGRWGTLYPHGLGLYVAHSIVTERADLATATAAAAGAVPLTRGIRSRSVDGVSVTYDERAIDWMLRSSYGERYKALLRQIGFGAVAV